MDLLMNTIIYTAIIRSKEYISFNAVNTESLFKLPCTMLVVAGQNTRVLFHKCSILL